MNTIYWRMNATQGGANLLPGVNVLPGAILHPGANCAHEHGFKECMPLTHKVLSSYRCAHILYQRVLSQPVLKWFNNTGCSMTFCFSFDVLIKFNQLLVNIKGGGHL